MLHCCSTGVSVYFLRTKTNFALPKTRVLGITPEKFWILYHCWRVLVASTSLENGSYLVVIGWNLDHSLVWLVYSFSLQNNWQNHCQSENSRGGNNASSCLMHAGYAYYMCETLKAAWISHSNQNRPLHQMHGEAKTYLIFVRLPTFNLHIYVHECMHIPWSYLWFCAACTGYIILSWQPVSKDNQGRLRQRGAGGRFKPEGTFVPNQVWEAYANFDTRTASVYNVSKKSTVQTLRSK